MGTSIAAQQWKPEESGGNRWGSQREIPTFGQVVFRRSDPQVIARRTFSGALNACLNHCGREHQHVAKDVHVSTGYLSKLLAGVWEAQQRRLVRFMQATQCVAPLEWTAEQMGFELRERKTELERRAEAAEAEAAELRAQIRPSSSSAWPPSWSSTCSPAAVARRPASSRPSAGTSTSRSTTTRRPCRCTRRTTRRRSTSSPTCSRSTR
jgi:hypothetical protein